MNDEIRQQVEQLAAASFTDPTDAPRFLDLAKYGDDPDADTIKADLAALLTAKPHLAKVEPARDLAAELEQFGFRPRGRSPWQADPTLAVDLAPYGLRPRSTPRTHGRN